MGINNYEVISWKLNSIGDEVRVGLLNTARVR